MRFSRDFVDSVEVFLTGLPVLLVVVAVVAAVRRLRRRPVGLLGWWAMTAVVVLAILSFTLLPGASIGPMHVDFVPLRDAYRNIRAGTAYGVANLLGNVTLFLPYGASVAALARPKWRKALVWCLVLPVVVEFLQYTLIDGRIVATDDVIAGLLGSYAGYRFVRFFDKPEMESDVRSAALVGGRDATLE